jgi:ATP-dependent helicase/nuclease subunit A
VLTVLRAIDDPSDRVSLVAALRSSFFGVSDRDLTAYVLAGGRLHMGPVEEDRPGAAALRPALGFLAELHKARTRLSIPALLERLYDETRVMAAFSGSRRGEARISNLEKVTALARQSAEIGVLTLRGFASLLQGRIETAREEPDLPSTRPGDPETVRVLSIHKAKGLEAPIVAVFDLADNYWLQSDVIALWAEGRVAIGFREGCQPPGWAALKNKDKAKAWAEARRLQYVACTRARDVLVIPKPSGDARVGDFWKDVVAALPSAGDADVRVVDADALPADESGEDAWTPTLVPGSDVDAVALRWEEQRRELLQEAATRDYLPIPVRELAARSAPPAVAPPGGAGRDFGRLVHRMLQWIPPDADAAQTAAMAAALAPAYGLDDAAAAQASETVRRCLALPLMDRVRRAPRVWRELPLRFPHEVHLAEGEVDLVFEEDGGLVVVDYKTDHIAEGQALDQAHHHAGQLRLYDRGLVQATGMKVRERLVLFTALGRAVPV